ncbi:MAG: Fe-S cluster assembly protein SufD [Crocinitomicaceae bacterium]|nr:Fe-S cluster assembly protein SufD [Crocinitomicaceae bacterium]
MSVAEFVKNLKPNNSEFGLKSKALLEGKDFPTTKDEYWKYTRLRKLTKNEFYQKDGSISTDLNSIWKEDIPNRLVVVNGIYSPELSKHNLNITSGIESIAKEIPGKDEINSGDDQIFSLIGKAFAQDGLKIDLNNTKEWDELQIIFVNTQNGAIANSLIRIKASKNANARILCNYVSEGAGVGFTNSYFNLETEANANLELINLQAENPNCFHVQSVNGVQARDSKISVWNFSSGADLIRNNVNIRQDGKGCDTHVNGLYYGEEKQHVDNHVFIDHASEDCESNELFKGVMNGQATGVFNGRVIVRKDSQRINAFQQNSNILLSDKATINSKPELEIYADDVKCSHGSVTGQLDENALFYLKARGISEDRARKMLVSSFLEEVVETLATEELKNYVVRQMAQKIDLLDHE